MGTSTDWNDAPTESLLRHIMENLQSRGATVSTAESCTGGLLATMLTELAGSSAVYTGGVSAYSNGVKHDLLQVEPGLLKQHGAVSGEVAQAMAVGAREVFGTTYALALTGVAGPGGGSPEKPVGTVYCGFASSAGGRAVRLNLDGDRSQIRWAAAVAALRLLVAEISN